MPHFQKADVVVLSDEQFAKIVELLTPGCEMAKLYLAEMQSRVLEMPASTPAPAPTPDP